MTAITSTLLIEKGFNLNGFGDYWLSISPLYGIRRTLYFQGDYLFMREGVGELDSAKDDIIVVWNKDVMKEFYWEQFELLYEGITGKKYE